MASRIAQAIEDLRFLVVKSRGPNAWFVNPPFAPWRRGAAYREREDLLRRMLTEGAIGGFWMDVGHREYLSDDIATPVPPSGDAFPWLFVKGEDVGQAVQDLDIGSWRLFLFNGLPDRPPASPQPLNTDPATAAAMLEGAGAYAVILSWEDDIEWMIVESAQPPAETPGRNGNPRVQLDEGGSSSSS